VNAKFGHPPSSVCSSPQQIEVTLTIGWIQLSAVFLLVTPKGDLLVLI